MHEVNYLTKPIYEMHEFPEHLAARGHDVAFWHFPEGFAKSQVRNLGFKSEIKGRVVDGASITLYTPESFAGNLLGRLRTALAARGLAKRILGDFRPELIVSFSVPTQGWQLLSVSRKLGIPVLFRALDVSHKIRTGLFSKLIYLAEKRVYRGAQWLSANNPAMLDYCISMGASSSRSSVDWPPIDLSRFEGASLELGLRMKIGVPEQSKVILYMGSFFYFSGLPEVIRAFSAHAHDEHLVLIGGGEQDEELRQLVAELGVQDKVTFTGFISFEELPKYLNLADVAVNPMQRTLVANAAIPNKVIQYLATGLTVVSTKLDGLEKTFGSSSRLSLVENAEEVVSRALELCRSHRPEQVSEGNLDLARFGLNASIEAFEARCEEVVKSV